MGEYWKAVNVDKRQQVHPHKVDDGGNGLKWREWVTYDSNTRRRIQHLIDTGTWAGDEIRAVSDYGGTAPLAGPPTDRPAEYGDEWEDVSTGPRSTSSAAFVTQDEPEEA